MITLVRLEPPAEFPLQVRTLQDLPAPGVAVSALAVRCVGLEQVQAALCWRLRHGAGGGFPFVLVVREEPFVLRAVALEPVPPTALLFDSELDGGRLPPWDFEAMWQQSVFAEVETRLLNRFRFELTNADAEVLRRLVAMGACGRRAASTARSLGVSESTLRRWLRANGLPSLGRLLRLARLEAVRAARTAGMDADLAAHACGWSGRDACRAALQRGAALREPGLPYGSRAWLLPPASGASGSPSRISVPASSPSSGGAKW